MLSAGMFEALALSTAVRRRGLLSMSPPPMRAAIVISRMTLVKSLPRLASSAPFLCLMECHFECPDMSFSYRILASLSKQGGAAIAPPWTPARYKWPRAAQKQKPRPLPAEARSHEEKNPGNVLLSHQATLTVPSALEGLTTVFGIGTGVTPPPWSPG